VHARPVRKEAEDHTPSKHLWNAGWRLTCVFHQAASHHKDLNNAPIGLSKLIAGKFKTIGEIAALPALW